MAAKRTGSFRLINTIFLTFISPHHIDLTAPKEWISSRKVLFDTTGRMYSIGYRMVCLTLKRCLQSPKTFLFFLLNLLSHGALIDYTYAGRLQDLLINFVSK